MIWMLWMTLGCLASWFVARLVRPDLGAEVFFGMLGPLVAVAGTWLLVERASRMNPAGVTSVMMAAFLVKMVFFGAYVAAVVTWWEVERTPFIVSFTGYFVTLYAAEALLLRRLFGRLT
jgi:hypothetical protein